MKTNELLKGNTTLSVPEEALTKEQFQELNSSQNKFLAWDKNFNEVVEITAIDWVEGRLKHKKSGKTWYRLAKYILHKDLIK